MKSWTKILPFFFIEWYAFHNCERVVNYSNGKNVTIVIKPFKNCKFIVMDE